MIMEITVNIVDTLFDSIPKGTVVANYVTEVDTVNFKMYSTVYSIDETNKAIVTTKKVDANNLEAIHFDAINWVTTDKATIDNIYPKVVSKYQNKFKKEGVIYKITKNYDLNGCVLTIPDNCTLQFEGGTITNGPVIGNINNDFVRSEWFGAKGDNIHDDTQAIQMAINLAENSCRKVILSNTIYRISNSIFIPDNFNFGGKQDNSLGAFKSSSKSATIYQYSNTPILNIGSSNRGARDLHIHDITLQSSSTLADYSKVYGIYVDNKINFSNSSFDNIQITRCRFGIYAIIKDYGGITENSFINVSLIRNSIGLYIEGIKNSANQWPWFNLNYFRLCYINENSIGGVYLKNITSTESDVFQSCNFENNGLNYNIDDYNTFGCFGYCSKADSYGTVSFEGCYFENNYPRKDGVILSNIDYTKESHIIVNNGKLIVNNCTISRTRSFVSILRNANVILFHNDYYLNNLFDSNISKSLITYNGINDSSIISLKVDEPFLKTSINTYIEKIYRFNYTNLSSINTLYSSVIDINSPLFGKVFYNKKYDNKSIIYIDKDKGNVNYLGSDKTNPFDSLGSLLNYGRSRYSSTNKIKIELLTDTTWNRINETFNKDIVINGNGHTITIVDTAGISLRNCSIKFINCNIVINNTNSSYSIIKTFGKCKVSFIECSVLFNTTNACMLIDARDYSSAYCYFNTFTINVKDNKSGANIIITRPRNYAKVKTNINGIINETGCKIFSEDSVDDSYTQYNYLTNLPISQLKEDKSKVYTDENGIWYNIDGTKLQKVKIVNNTKQITTQNTIYKIVQDIDLQGEELTIPYGCTLDFQGGSFSNGTINLNSCKVLPLGANIYDYLTDIDLEGSYKGSSKVNYEVGVPDINTVAPGVIQVDSPLGKLAIATTTGWRDAMGWTYAKHKGTTEERPTLETADEGFPYYDSTLKMYICWNGTIWTNLDGTALN